MGIPGTLCAAQKLANGLFGIEYARIIIGIYRELAGRYGNGVAFFHLRELVPHITAAFFAALAYGHFFDGGQFIAKLQVEGRSPELKTAAERSEGIRILAQDSFEALVTFIISQCNNIPRIKGLCGALCERYGSVIESEHGIAYAFPTPESILAKPMSALTELKVGYRDEYIYSACRAVCEGILDEIRAAKTTREAEQILCSMHGIGKKVASCVLLFGFRRLDAFPVDVWMKRALARLFPGVRDYSVFGQYAGVAQQYMFYAERYTEQNNELSS